MHLVIAIYAYIDWHYSKAYRDFWKNWTTFLSFLFRFFSIKLLIRTLFSPWERMSESYKKGFDPGDFFSTLIVNVIVRIIGFVVRFITIFVGLIVITFSFIAGILAFVVWTVLPILVAFLFAIGLSALI